MKIRALTLSTALAFIASSLWMSSPSEAQAPTERSAPNHQGWYQVEMIIFSRNNPSLQEHFPSNIHLSYPSRWQVLKDPNPVANNPIATESELTITPTDSLSESNTSIGSSIDLNTQPFYYLPAELRQLNSAADKFLRSGDFSVLFHQAWRQPITSQQQADWILINNSRNNEKSPLLSGSIRLSVATYLRLDTKLWFAEFEPKLDDTPSIWPEIPESPDQIIEEVEATESELLSIAPAQETPNELPLTSEAWQTKRIILLKDKREMRSNEINYIDHPVIGIMIKISPFSPIPDPTKNVPLTE